MVVQSEQEVVISGIAGFLPRSNNIEEFQKHLLDNEYMVGEARWKKGRFDVCHKAGIIPDIRYFDSSFFNIHRKQTRYLDPMQRLALEKTFEALTDAGVNLNEVKGKRVGVYMASTISENDSLMCEVVDSGFGVTGLARSMLANRISYWMNVTGPSCAVDANWNGGIQAIKIASEAIKTGQCEAAVVGAVNLNLNIGPTYAMHDLGVTCMDGINKSFDDNADGYLRSECVCVLFLQRAEDAKRHYAAVVHADLQYNGEHDGPLREVDQNSFVKFLNKFYNKCGVDPKDVQYLEAYGSGIKKLDELELNVGEQVFCKNRGAPLAIGSVKSNAGHAEASADMMSIFKVLIAMETEIIPANLHYKTPNRNIPGLTNGAFEVVTKNKPWKPSYAAINSFGLASTFGHLLLKACAPAKEINECDLPLLKIFSTRSEEGINEIIDTVVSESVKDLEYTSLINDTFASTIQGHLFRGYVMEGTAIKHESSNFPGIKKAVWFVYSGLGSQWPQMGKELMRLPIFAASIDKCHKILEPKGVNLRSVITDNDSQIYDNILHSFVGIAAIQIGLTDVLHTVGIVPDGLIGHSVGELGCAYADGCLTAEQMILSAYYRGKASQDVELVPGSMAAVGLGHKKIKELCPPSIDVACHNGADSSTISGPKEEMEKFVAKLKADGIFARLVNVSNIAYHSQYIKPVAPLLLKYLQELIPAPKTRSTKWISTSVEENNWTSDLLKTCSGEYLTNNLLSSVYFEEGCRYIPRDSIVIEIAPHGLLQSILKSSLCSDVTNVSLTKRGNEKGLEFLLSALGKLYLTGIDLDLGQLYPSRRWPVSRGTKSLCNLVRWSHIEEWRTGLEEFIDYAVSAKTHIVNINNAQFQHMIGYRIGRKFVVPSASLLMLVCQLRSSIKSAVLFENISIKRHMLQLPTDSETIEVSVHRGTGDFEIAADDNIIISGKITIPESFEKEYITLYPINTSAEHTTMDANDFYSELHDRGYNFKGDFRSVKNINLFEDGALGKLEWKNNWPVLITSMMQLYMHRVGENSQNILLPSFIRRILINLNETPDETTDIDVHYDYNMEEISSKYVQISNIECKPFTEQDNLLTVENYKFVKYHNENMQDLQAGVDVTLQVILQNLKSKSNVYIYDFQCESSKNIEKHVQDFGRRNPLVNINYTMVEHDDSNFSIPHSPMVIIGENNMQNIEQLLTKTSDFVLLCVSKEQKIALTNTISSVLTFTVGQNSYHLLKKINNELPAKILNIPLRNVHSADLQNDGTQWVKQLSENLSTNNNKIKYLVFKEMPLDGLENFVTGLKSKYETQKIRFLFMFDETAPECKLAEPFYKEIFQKDLFVSVFQDGVWGNYLYTTISIPINEKCNHLSENCLSELKAKFDLKYLGLNSDTWICDDDRNDYKLGPLEYSGYDKFGNRVMGIARVDMNKLEIIPDPILMWNIPEKWTFIDAATVPYSYAMAYYILKELLDIKPNSIMLIHNACSSFGRALCQLGLQFGYNMYVSIGSEVQRAYVLPNMHPIGDEQIFDYTDSSFEQKLLLATHGRGADVIMNTLPGDRMRASYGCVSDGGLIVQVDVSEEDVDTTIGLGMFKKCFGLYGVKPDHLLDFSDEMKRSIHDLVKDGLDKNMIWFHRRKLFSGLDVGSALSYLNSKIVIGSAIVSAEKLFKEDLAGITNYTHYKCDKSASYLIYGDHATIITGLSQWLATRGCQKIIIITNTTQDHYIKRRMSLLQKYHGTRIKLIINNKQIDTKSMKFLEEANKFASISTVFVLPKSNDVHCIEYLRELDLNLHEVAHKAHMVCLWADDKNTMVYKRVNSNSGSNVRWLTTQKFSDVVDYFGRVLMDSADIVLRDEKNVEAVKLYKDFYLMLPETGTNLLSVQCESRSSDGVDLMLMTSRSTRPPMDVPPFFILPDMLGVNTAHLKAFVRKLMYPAYVVHLNQAASTDFDTCVPIIVQKIKETYWRGPYNLIGVSWGGALAIEVAKELEATSNEQVELFLIDGIPDTIQAFIEEEFTTSDKFELNLLKYLLDLQPDDMNGLLTVDNWNIRVEMAVNILNMSKKKHQRMSNVLHLIKSRIESIMSYKPSDRQMNGFIHLFIPVDSTKTNSHSLTKYCKQVTAEILPGNHFTLLLDDTLANFVNDNAILRA